MNDWTNINERIKQCRKLGNLNETIACLKKLFQETQDGMVAFALGEELERAGRFVEAVEYFSEAEARFPLVKFQNRAREAIRRLKARLGTVYDDIRESVRDKEIESAYEKGTAKIPVISSIIKKKIEVSGLESGALSDTLIITACTKMKIWDYFPDAPEYVPALLAYVGDGFLNFIAWIKEREDEKKLLTWFILSGKYGFIEPWHPISYYNVNIDKPEDFPITFDALVNQAKQIRYRQANRKNTFRLVDYKKVLAVNCPPAYIEKIKLCFPGKEIIELTV
jgi:tetratricopeptide (TPR) repeat protein